MTTRQARADVVALARDAYRLQSAEVARAAGGVAARPRGGPRDYARESSFESLVRAAAAAGAVYVGDYHTNPASQRTFLRLCAAVRPRVGRFAVGVEFVPSRHQRDLDAYLGGRLSETTFLGRIRYRRLWPYDVWPAYRPIFEFARAHALPVLALDALDAVGASGGAPGATDLAARERHAARLAAAWLAPRPDARLLVQFGQTHVLPAALPAQVDRELRARGASRRRLIVSQNLADLWFRLVARGRERVRVLEVRRDHFCVMSSPPAREQESYRAWLDEGVPLRPVARLLARFLGARVPLDIGGVAPGLGAAAREAMFELHRRATGREPGSGLRDALGDLARRLVDPSSTPGERLYRDLAAGRMTREDLSRLVLGRRAA